MLEDNNKVSVKKIGDRKIKTHFASLSIVNYRWLRMGARAWCVYNFFAALTFDRWKMISLKFIPSASLARPLWPNICRTLSTVPAKPAGASLSIGKKRFRLPTEKNVDKLVSHCCGANYFKEGEEIKLKDDSEYPEWLWELPLKPPHLHELDPNTKEYWERAEVVGKQREWRLQSLAEVSLIFLHSFDASNSFCLYDIEKTNDC